MASAGVVGGGGAGAILSGQDAHKLDNNEDEATDGTESADDFFDAEDSAPIPRSSGTPITNNQPMPAEKGNNSVHSSSADDEGEFVMIDHPQQQQQQAAVPSTIVTDNNKSAEGKGEAKEKEGDPVANFKQEPLLTENNQSSKPDVAEFLLDPVKKDQAAVQPSSPFDAVFGVADNQHPEEDEPVMVSSFTESEVSDPFTVSTNSSTHRVAPPPPPPQSRQSRSASLSNAAPMVAKQPTKKPPAPPPQHRVSTNINPTTTPLVSNDDFDAIFGTPTEAKAKGKGKEAVVNTGSNENGFKDEFETYFSDPKFNNNPQTNTSFAEQDKQGGFDSVFAVTPHAAKSTVAEKAVPSASAPFEVTKDQGSVGPASVNDQQAFSTQKEPQLFASVSNDSNRQAIDDDNDRIQEVSSLTAKGENQGVAQQSRGVFGEEDKLKSYTSSKLNNDSTQASKKGENDDKKKKKKKGIVSWAKHFGGKKKDKKPETKPSKKAEATTSVHSSNSGIEDSIAQQPSTTTSGAMESAAPASAYDLDTIQGSHIAELVNMGFEPAVALEALDRYDQDIEKATNYLLDQAYR